EDAEVAAEGGPGEADVAGVATAPGTHGRRGPRRRDGAGVLRHGRRLLAAVQLSPRLVPEGTEAGRAAPLPALRPAAHVGDAATVTGSLDPRRRRPPRPRRTGDRPPLVQSLAAVHAAGRRRRGGRSPWRRGATGYNS